MLLALRLLYEESLARTGTADLSFSFSLQDTGEQRFSGPAALAFTFSEALSGAEGFTATGSLTFTFSESDTGEQRFSGPGALAFDFSEAASGAVIEPVTGTAELVFAFTEALEGSVPVEGFQIGHGPFGYVHLRPKEALVARPERVYGRASLGFSFALDIDAHVTDDELVLALAA